MNLIGLAVFIYIAYFFVSCGVSLFACWLWRSSKLAYIIGGFLPAFLIATYLTLSSSAYSDFTSSLLTLVFAFGTFGVVGFGSAWIVIRVYAPDSETE
jgi:hypothetical protein